MNVLHRCYTETPLVEIRQVLYSHRPQFDSVNFRKVTLRNLKFNPYPGWNLIEIEYFIFQDKMYPNSNLFIDGKKSNS